MSDNRKNVRTLIIFAREPEWHKVKTRLAKDTSSRFALITYRALLKDTLHLARQSVADQVVVFYACSSDQQTQPFLRRWTKGFLLVPQVAGDLGERMQAAFEMVQQRGSGRMVIIGSDCPFLSKEDINQAFIALEDNDAILGPSLDGGYYLLGVTRVVPWLFEDMPWSQDALWQETTQRMKQHGWQLATLNPYRDIDTLADVTKSWKAVVNQERYRYTKTVFKKLNSFVPDTIIAD